MSEDLNVVPAAVDALAATATGAGEMINAAGAFNAAEFMAEAMTAIGPLGAVYLAALAPAQANNQASTLLLGALHTSLGAALESSKATFIAADAAR